MMNQNPAQVFSDNWDIYKKLMQCNYMHHAEFSQHTASLLSELNQQPLFILDIGCGDAIPVLPHLLSHGNINYTGYDLSGPALALADTNLKDVSGTISLKEGNMLGLLAEEKERFDLIISSFAIHHLLDEEKMILLQNCYQHLRPGGRMIYTDIFIDKQKDRESYLEEYINNIKLNWPLMKENEKQLIYDHILQFDFPSSLNKTIDSCFEFGFTVSIVSKPDKWHTMLLKLKNE